MGDFLHNTLSAGPWVLLALIPPAVVLLYFLKLKRVPLEVPSTYLWQKSIEDLHVNSIWQRLRKNLLLFLQLLLLLLIMLSLLRPGWRSTAGTKDRSIFLVDNSASMSAIDVQPTRLAEAKRRIRELIDNMGSGDKAMIIAFADGAQVVQEFTDNRRRLRERLDAIEPTDENTSLDEALKLAAGLANPGRVAFDERDIQVADAQPADLYLFTDGKFPTVANFSLGNLTPIYVPIGDPEVGNVGITAFSTRRHESKAGMLQAYAQLENNNSRDAKVTAEFYIDGELANAEQVTLAAGERQGLVFPFDSAGAARLRLELSPRDPLRVDDVAYAVVNDPRRGRVLLVTPGNSALELALATARAKELAEVETVIPAYLETETYRIAAAEGHYDLVIFDQCAAGDALPRANTLSIGRVPSSAWGDAQAVPKVANPQIIDTNRAHPIMQLVDLDTIDIAEGAILSPPAGATLLIESGAGPLAAIAPRDGFEDAVFGFEIFGKDDAGETYVNTNWPLRSSFPTFVFNMLQYLAGPADSVAGGSVRPGEPVRFRSVTGVASVDVDGPGGSRHEVKRNQQHEFQFSQTDHVGIYEIREGKNVTQRFAVNLFDSSESDIAPNPEAALQIGYVEVEGRSGWEFVRRELWKFLLLLALFVLAIEWYIYNRRIYI
ncbi:MAG: BatA and WFA domain-containing protein [Planctomycetales bacterium]|nr:BatA and WFA domain-containing protein [Planctomycetales bacterium]